NADAELRLHVLVRGSDAIMQIEFDGLQVLIALVSLWSGTRRHVRQDQQQGRAVARARQQRQKTRAAERHPAYLVADPLQKDQARQTGPSEEIEQGQLKRRDRRVEDQARSGIILTVKAAANDRLWGQAPPTMEELETGLRMLGRGGSDQNEF